MSDCRKCAKFEECAVDEDCGLFKPKPQTNADRIRSMTDEELAIIFNSATACLSWMLDNWECPSLLNCEECWIKWLKEEVQNG